MFKSFEATQEVKGMLARPKESSKEDMDSLKLEIDMKIPNSESISSFRLSISSLELSLGLADILSPPELLQNLCPVFLSVMNHQNLQERKWKHN